MICEKCNTAIEIPALLVVGTTYLIKDKDKYGSNEVREYTLFRMTDKCAGFTYDDPHEGKLTIRRKWFTYEQLHHDYEIVDSYKEHEIQE